MNEVSEDDVWQALGRGVADRRHGFRTPVCATIGLDGTPRARTVVLRGASRGERVLWFHTDLRSPKVAELRANPAIALTLYDRKARLQVRVAGTAHLRHDDARADQSWQATTDSARRCYAVEPGPGVALDAPGSGMTPALEAQVITEAEAGLARTRFVVVWCVAHELDVLSLHHAGHRRMRLRWEDEWKQTWCVP
jgi:pyridoxamine 5'-phosphate oxidase